MRKLMAVTGGFAALAVAGVVTLTIGALMFVTAAVGGTDPEEETAQKPQGARTTQTAIYAPGIPPRALSAYQQAATNAPCAIRWQTVAAVGWVETKHGTVGGLDIATGKAVPTSIGEDGRQTVAIYGLPLNGSGGQQRYTPNPLWPDGVDRAAGALQFTSATWAAYGTDGDGDGRTDPQDIDDAAPATAAYLCASGIDRNEAMALGAYNAGANWDGVEGRKYARAVLAYADGLTPAVDLIEALKSGWPNAPAMPVTARTLEVARSIEAQFGPPKKWAGWRPASADSIVGGYHPKGRAVDYYIFEDSTGWDPAAPVALGDRLAIAASAIPDVEEVIFSGWIFSGGRWHVYRPPCNPNGCESLHRDHVHLSIGR